MNRMVAFASHHWSPIGSHISQSNAGVRLATAETSFCSNHVTVGVRGGLIPFQEGQL